MRRLADGWFPRVEPGPDLDKGRHIVATAAAETGSDPASIGIVGGYGKAPETATTW
jgi:alkanesulfonate monooxygenase SsuD/methylene tetrahydromethanopterin reductase-like flavin-dependent oxidoreductase (luciferase family)